MNIKFKEYARRFARTAGSKLIELSDSRDEAKDSLPEQDLPESNDHDDLYYSDQPISSKNEDRFNRANFAKHLAKTIITRRDPTSIVLGVYGAWGDGKTSVIEMMAEELQTHEDIVIIKFNPWIFQSEELLLRGFFSTLAQGLGRSLPPLKEKIGRVLDDYGSILSLASVSLGGIFTIKPGEAVKGLGKKLSHTDINQERRKIESILEENKLRIVIFIDDIDRLDKDETHAIFKLVKLSASFRYTSYVLAFDYHVVSAALGDRYADGGQKSGSAFLEKIIQVPLHLPPADELSLRQMAFQGADAALKLADIILEKRQPEKFTVPFIDGLQQKLTTPRLAKRFGNALLFSLPLLKGEVNVIDLMLIEGIRVFYPDVYIFIRENPNIFLQGIKDEKYRASNALETSFSLLFKEKFPYMPDEERKRLTRGTLEALFPRIRRTNYGDGWDKEWAKEQKICSPRYFSKYFTYSVPKGGVSDNVFQILLDSFQDLSNDEQDSVFATFSDQNSISTVIQRLREMADDIHEDTAKSFIHALARNSHLIPRERGPMVIGGTWMQAGILVSDLILRTSQGSRKKIVEDMFKSYPADFGFEVYRWIHNYEDKSEERKFLTDEEEADVAQILATKIMDEDSITPLYKKYGNDAPKLYWFWQQNLGNSSVETTLKNHLNLSKNEVELFLESFIGTGWIVERGEPVRSDLDKKGFENITSFIPAEYVIAKLRDIYGAELDFPQYHPKEKYGDNRLTAHQFVYLHLKQKEDDEKARLESSSEK